MGDRQRISVLVLAGCAMLSALVARAGPVPRPAAVEDGGAAMAEPSVASRVAVLEEKVGALKDELKLLAAGKDPASRGLLARHEPVAAVIGLTVPVGMLMLWISCLAGNGTKQPDIKLEKECSKRRVQRDLWDRAKTYDQVQHTRLTVIVALHSLLLVGGLQAICDGANVWLVVKLSWLGVVLLVLGAIIVANLDVRIRAVNKLLGRDGKLCDEAHQFWLESGRGGITSSTIIGVVLPGVFFAGYVGLILVAAFGLPG